MVGLQLLSCILTEAISGSDNQTDDVASKEVEELPSGDLRRRLGKKSTPSQSESKSEETSPTTDVVKTEAERIVVRYVSYIYMHILYIVYTSQTILYYSLIN